MDTNTFTSRKVLLQDLGILLLMLSILGGSVITAVGGKELLYQHIALLLAVMLIVLLVVLRARTVGTIMTAVSLLAFTVFKLYQRFAFRTPIEMTAFFWPLILLGALGGSVLFISLYASIEGINGILNQRIAELTVIDPVTNIENMRSMVLSLRRYMALSERNGTQMGLMLVRMRYAEEIRKVLSRQQFNDLRAILASTVQHTLRLEDRVFSVDDQGSLGVIYFSNETGVPVVKSRIMSAVEGKDMLPDLDGQKLVVELSVVWKQYDSALGKDAMRYISEVESEFAYEV